MISNEIFNPLFVHHTFRDFLSRLEPLPKFNANFIKKSCITYAAAN